MNLKEYVSANRKRKARVGDAEFEVAVATQEQLERFQSEAGDGDRTPAAQVQFYRRWLAELVPEYSSLQECPPALEMEIFQAAVAVAFQPRKNA